MPAPSADRTRARIQALATAGLDLPTFATAAVEVLRTALPFSAACVGTVDPATEIVTATVKWGGLTDGEDDQWAFHEYEAPDLYDFRDVMRRPGAVASTHHETDGDPHRSRRFTEFFHPTYGFDDELRAGCSADGITWGLFALFRDGPGSAFTVAEHEFVSSVSSAFAVGYRTALLTNAADPVVTAGVDGPGVLVVDAAGEVAQANLAAAAHVDDLGGGAIGDDPLPFPVLALVGAARRFALGEVTLTPRSRLRTRSGRWVVVHASPLVSRNGSGTDVVVTIEEARPPEIVPLVVAAFGLTAREQDVVTLVLRGVDTTEIARTLHLSAYTVQDHLKSIFDKVGVRSRRELTGRVFLDQYAPRLAARAPLTPSGWFADPTPERTARSRN
ncbi:regulatory protein LuxR [Pseudonocardia dioxanivorans CB1190]|uniref:Regulatory protein LuxR n=1 Tax=Pseudonocardia dioxanivorans (strain ATCC 55486 / DSM 44775 / JCM 13855 / CB1190) TaxID=675635 RepID=F4CSJ4_PSEUX|nr:helix-turn-helix transcriptional regulator [Pseudonocardia dioxanivorans]AEA23704.1 regulatory protein LuxR [Pseudonocardia dioxanivorans CB1190]